MSRDYLEWSQFEDPDSSVELIRNAIRQSINYDAFNDQRVWQAMVLTPARRIDNTEAAGLGAPNRPGSSDEGVGIINCSSPMYRYKARILGENSPHLMLPDPCNLDTSSDSGYVEAVIEMHIDVLCVSTGQVDPPGEGDIVQIQLKHNDHSYNMQAAQHMRTIARNTSEDSFLNNQGCSLKFESFDDMSLFVDQPLPTGGNLTDIIPVGPHVLISQDMQAFLIKLRKNITKDQVRLLEITSGVRTAEAQARALRDKRTYNGCNSAIAGKPASGSPCKPIYDLYRGSSKIMDVLRVPNDLGMMTQVIQRQVAAKKYLSPHMKGRGLDLRTKTLSEEQVSIVMDAVRTAGGSPIYEPDPPHIHVTIPASGNSTTTVASTDEQSAAHTTTSS